MLSSRTRTYLLSGLAFLAVAAGALVATPAQALAATHDPQAWGTVHNNASPRCLDSGIPANAQLWKCSGSIYQSWVFTAFGGIVGNSPTGCLDEGAGVNGSGVFLTACTGSYHQRWSFGPNFSLVNLGSGRCLDADLATIGQQGTKVQVWDCSYASNQQWIFENYA